MRSPYEIILRPHITEKTVALSFGNPNLPDSEQVRKYTFVVAPDATKIEIKKAIEAIYNAGKRKKEDMITVEKVNVINVRGKMRRVGWKSRGQRPNWRKAIVTLGKGQMLDDYGV